MKLWLLSQSINRGYDTYDSAIVAAKNEKEARNIHPSEVCEYRWIDGKGWMGTRSDGELYAAHDHTWADAPSVEVQLLGTAKPGTQAGIICASFNAG